MSANTKRNKQHAESMELFAFGDDVRNQGEDVRALGVECKHPELQELRVCSNVSCRKLVRHLCAIDVNIAKHIPDFTPPCCCMSCLFAGPLTPAIKTVTSIGRQASSRAAPQPVRDSRANGRDFSEKPQSKPHSVARVSTKRPPSRRCDRRVWWR